MRSLKTLTAAAVTTVVLAGGSTATGSSSPSDPDLTITDVAPLKCYDKTPDGGRKPVPCPDIIVSLPVIPEATQQTLECYSKNPRTGKLVKVRCPDIIAPHE